MTKIVFYSFASHCDAGYIDVYLVLKDKGFDVNIIRYLDIIPKDTDILFITSNGLVPKNIPSHTKIFFLPHGIGNEYWWKIMNKYDEVFLAGKKPIIPPIGINNYKIIGWAKSDAIFNPRKEIIERVNDLVSNLPFNKSVLLVPTTFENILSNLDYVVKFLEEQKINVFIPFRKTGQEYSYDVGINRYNKFKHVRIPDMDDILNVYYFLPHIDMSISFGMTSIIREFYITKVPSMQIETYNIDANRHIYEDCKIGCDSLTKFPKMFLDAWNNPSEYLQSEEVTKEFIEINDGKVIERIIKEIEK